MGVSPSTLLGTDTWDVPTGGFDATFAIGLSFIFLAYGLDPFIVSAYDKVRAYRAWRAIEKHERVEVTSFSMFAELLGRRGSWDAPAAEFLTQPPSIFLEEENGTVRSRWLVYEKNEIYGGLAQEWYDLPNVDRNAGHAKSRYFVHGYQESFFTEKGDAIVDGNIIVAKWTKEAKMNERFSYKVSDLENDSVTVNSVEDCGDEPVMDVILGNNSQRWGSVLHCEEGPQKVDGGNASAQPAIILKKDDEEGGTGDTHVIVEEAAQYPSFLYSVWNASGSTVNAANETGSGVELKYAFHVASTVRLAEAVVTGIVNGEDTGGGCFGLLRKYSEDYASNSTQDGKRASPFGEKPSMNEFVDNLEEVEAIEHGIKIGVNGVVCFSLLGVLSSIGVLWSFFMRSRVEMDIYDRDHLLRTVSLQAQGLRVDPEKNSTMPIYVQKEHNGSINVIITESDAELGGFASFLLRRGRSKRPAPVARDGGVDDFGSEKFLPETQRRVTHRGSRTSFGSIGGAHTGRGRAFPGRSGRYSYPSSSNKPDASPVPSNAGSRAATPTSAMVDRMAVTGIPMTPRPERSRSILLCASPVHENVRTPARSRAGSKPATPTIHRKLSVSRLQGSTVLLGASPARSYTGSRIVTPNRSNPVSLTGTPVAAHRSNRPDSRIPVAEGGERGVVEPSAFAVMQLSHSALFDDSAYSALADDCNESNSGEFRPDIQKGRTSLSPALPQVSAHGRGGYREGHSRPTVSRRPPQVARRVTANSTPPLGPDWKANSERRRNLFDNR